VFLDIIPSIRALPVLAAWPDVEEVLTQELRRAYYGQASVGEVIRAAQSNAGRFLSR
jgi:multiple sugar transport system substrate-binding protein